MYPFQENCLNEFKDNRYNIILKSRQLGISTLSAGFALWTMLFKSDKNILVIATGKDVAKNLVTKVRVMYDNLPSWLKTNVEETNKLSLRFKNGSQIKAIASNESAGRSEALSLLILDEAAFIDKVDEMVAWVKKHQPEGYLFLFAASSLGNMCIHKLHEIAPNNTYIDIGSSLNPDMKLSIDRGYLCGWAGQLWRGHDMSKELIGEEIW